MSVEYRDQETGTVYSGKTIADLPNYREMRDEALSEHPYLTLRVEDTARKVDEIHEFIQMLGTALNNPMVRAMIPANLRGNIGG